MTFNHLTLNFVC